MKIIGYEIFTNYPSFPIKEQQIINTLNPHSYCVAKKDSLFKEALQNSDIILPDGIGIVYAAQILYGEKIKRIAGADIHLQLLREAEKKGLKVFYLGAHPKTLKWLKIKANNEFPSVIIATYSPPYRKEFSIEESNQMIQSINVFNPDILFVGMTAPKQEKWVHLHKSQLRAKVICSIGAVFEFYAGTIKRPGKFWQSLGLEWLPRLVREPRRLWRRTFISTPEFIIDVIKEKVRLLFRP